MELWKDIKGYEGLYQVSTEGNVRSCNWRNRGFTRNLFLKVHNKGYHQVELVKDGKKKTFLVHRLVAETFLPNVNGYSIVNHIDEVKTNNNVENLEWCTLSQNSKAYYTNHPKANCFPRHREANKHNKSLHGDTWKRVCQLKMSGEIIKIWESALEVARTNNWSQWSISECCRGKTSKAYGYKWKYAD